MPTRAPVVRHIIDLIASYRYVSNSLNGLGRDLIRRSRVKCIIRSQKPSGSQKLPPQIIRGWARILDLHD
ncbi:hypothetical protein PIB30_080190, partial [Stylosanthes scabra]|nr:hypothetical protein [Stylosanthes scabra]